MRENNLTIKKARSRLYPAEIFTDANYTDDLVLDANTPSQAESLLYSLEQAARGISLSVNADKSFHQEGVSSSLHDKPLKLVDQFTYFGSSISFTESTVIICIGKA